MYSCFMMSLHVDLIVGVVINVRTCISNKVCHS